MEPIFANEFDISKVAYGAPRTLDSGAKHIRVSYKRGAFLVQTPDMVAPFGVNKWENPGSAAKHTLELSFKDIEDRPELQEFKSMIQGLEKKIISDAFSGALPTHNKKFTSIDVVEVLYQPMIKAKDEKYAPNFKITLPVDDKGNFSFPTYVLDPKNRAPKLVDLKTVQTKGAVCTVIMQCTGIWVAGGSNFGCTWKATQLRVQPPVSKTDYAFKDVGKFLDPSAEEDIDDDKAMHEEDEASAGKLDKQLSGHEDGEEEEDADGGEEEEDDEEEDDLETPVVSAKPAAKAVAPKGRAKAGAK